MTCIVTYHRSYLTRPECPPFHDHTLTHRVYTNKLTKLVSREQLIWGFWSGSTSPCYIHLCKKSSQKRMKEARVCLKNN